MFAIKGVLVKTSEFVGLQNQRDVHLHGAKSCCLCNRQVCSFEYWERFCYSVKHKSFSKSRAENLHPSCQKEQRLIKGIPQTVWFHKDWCSQLFKKRLPGHIWNWAGNDKTVFIHMENIQAFIKDCMYLYCPFSTFIHQTTFRDCRSHKCPFSLLYSYKAAYLEQ